MNPVMTAALFAVVAMATQTLACENALTAEELQEFYCSSDVVFRGFNNRASSGFYRNMQGHRIQSASYTYRIEDMFKGTEPPSSSIVVRVTRNLDLDSCTQYVTDGQADSALVFASASGRFQMLETCRHSVPWSCVSESLRSSLSNITC
ncbi:hypothetical protein EGW08_020099 [Elysia chlorotica]|uniref:NTR domain-containing protein n=1 Tax=Elysia chlorotica TaxID=188477 RepID=A0A433SS89_ELYCH|nr:hypothetical protein EGW08_020099 [Elysia chlorotica]